MQGPEQSTSQFLVNSQDSIADKQNLHTQVRGVTPTQFGELVCSIRHGLSKHALQDLTTLIKDSNFFKPAEWIGYGQLKNRNQQLLPLLLIDIVAREVELILTGSPLKDMWTNQAVVQPIACGLADGKVFRSSPQFTFAFISINNVQYKLGDDAFAEAASSVG